MAAGSRFIVTGPAVCEEKDTAELGLSFAITVASARAHAHLESTFYVRRIADDVLVGQTDSHHDGSVTILGPEQLGVIA
jgi:hypothetical protein